MKKRLQQLEKRTGDTSSIFHHTPDILNIIRDRYTEHEKVEYSNWSCTACTYINLAQAMECDMCGGSRDVTTSVVIIDIDDTLEEAVLDIDAVEVRETSDSKRSRKEECDETIDTGVTQPVVNAVMEEEEEKPAIANYMSSSLSDEYIDSKLK